MSTMAGVTLFHIGLATPASTVIQIIICTVFYIKTRKTNNSFTATRNLEIKEKRSEYFRA